MKLEVLPITLAICRLGPSEQIPSWAGGGQGIFLSITRTHEELSIVCEQSLVPPGVKSENNWKAFKVTGPLDFSLTGILASIANPLASEKISLFAVSTYDTDFVLVKDSHWSQAHETLLKAGFSFV